jgi:hypothetical protein
MKMAANLRMRDRLPLQNQAMLAKKSLKLRTGLSSNLQFSTVATWCHLKKDMDPTTYLISSSPPLFEQPLIPIVYCIVSIGPMFTLYHTLVAFNTNHCVLKQIAMMFKVL